MDIEKAKELFKMRIETEEYSGMTTNTLKEAMTTVLAELEKKDKIIDLIVKEFYKKTHISTKCYLQTSIEECLKHKNCINCLIEYFTNKAENVGE